MARIGGAFPFPLAQPQEGGGVISLPSGGVYYPSPGEYTLTTGDQTVLQWWDPINQIWRVVGAPNTQMIMLSSDGYNYRLLNASGIVTGALITNAGSGATNGVGATATGVAISFGSAPTNGVAATAYPIVGGSISSTITITQAGTGFVQAPLIVIDPPSTPGGIQATAVCRISAGAIAAVTVINTGAGYTAVPNVYVIPQLGSYGGGPSGGVAAATYPPPGLVFQTSAVPGNQNLSSSGAQLTATLDAATSATLTGIVVINPGALYTGTSIPTITITGAGAAAATAIMSMCVSSVTVSAAGAAVSVAPAWMSTMGLVAATDDCNGTYMARPAYGTTTLSTTTVGTFVVEQPGFGFQKVPVIGIIPAGGTIYTTIPAGTAVIGSKNDFSILQPRVQ